VLGQPPAFIVIQSDRRTVADSRRLGRHDAFTHFFLKPGDYSFVVGHTPCRLRVTDHREFSTEEQEKRAQEPLLIIVNGNEPSVKDAKIIAGQTVVWAIESGENVYIETTAGAASAT